MRKQGSNEGTPTSGPYPTEALPGRPGPEHLALSVRKNGDTLGQLPLCSLAPGVGGVPALLTGAPPEPRTRASRRQRQRHQKTEPPEQTWQPASLGFCLQGEPGAGAPLSPLLFGSNPLPGDPEIGRCSRSCASSGCRTSTSVHTATQEAWFSRSLQPHCIPTGCMGQGPWPAGGAWATGCNCCWDCQM